MARTLPQRAHLRDGAPRPLLTPLPPSFLSTLSVNQQHTSTQVDGEDHSIMRVDVTPPRCSLWFAESSPTKLGAGVFSTY